MIDRNFMLISRFDASFMSFVIIVHFYDSVHFSVYRLIVKLCAFERSKTKMAFSMKMRKTSAHRERSFLIMSVVMLLASFVGN